MKFLKQTYKKYNDWADTWSMSQLIFLSIIVFSLGGLGILLTFRLDEARKIIEILSQ